MIKQTDKSADVYGETLGRRVRWMFKMSGGVI